MKKKFMKLLAFLAVFTLIGCAPNSDPAKAKAKLDENGYTVAFVNNEKILGLVASGLVATITAAKDEEAMYAYYFSTADYAKAYYKSVEEDMKETKEKAKEDGKKYEYGYFGKVVYSGTPEALKAAR